MLRDRLVCCVNHDGIQKKVLAEKELDFDKAHSVAVAIEVAERDTKNLKAERTHGNSVLYSHSKERGNSSRRYLLVRTRAKLRAIGVEVTTLQMCVVTRTLSPCM